MSCEYKYIEIKKKEKIFPIKYKATAPKAKKKLTHIEQNRGKQCRKKNQANNCNINLTTHAT